MAGRARGGGGSLRPDPRRRRSVCRAAGTGPGHGRPGRAPRARRAPPGRVSVRLRADAALDPLCATAPRRAHRCGPRGAGLRSRTTSLACGPRAWCSYSSWRPNDQADSATAGGDQDDGRNDGQAEVGPAEVSDGRGVRRELRGRTKEPAGRQLAHLWDRRDDPEPQQAPRTRSRPPPAWSRSRRCRGT